MEHLEIGLMAVIMVGDMVVMILIMDGAQKTMILKLPEAVGVPLTLL